MNLTDQSIATQASIDVIDAETDKIDSAATLGLEGTSNSLAYRVMELERHFHNVERW